MLGNINVDKKKILKKKLKTITRSLFYKKDLSMGTKLKREHLISIRPGSGLSPQNLNKILGKKLKKNVKKYSPVKKVHI